MCLQHEYGIFGGKAGSHVLELLQRLTMPVVTTLHTVLSQPDLDQRVVMQQIAARSDRLIVMSEYSSRVLRDIFGVPGEKIDLIPHGIPDLPFVEPEVYKGALGVAGKLVLLTFGLLSPNKGFESVIRALPRILGRHSDAVYVIAGATHPHVRAREGDRYRDQLQALARELGVEREVIFHNRFFSPQEMASQVGSADIYITPYCHVAVRWFPLRIRRQSRLRQLSSWTTIWSAMQCANALTSMLAKWSGTGWRNLICAPSHGLSHVARNLRIWDFPPRL